MSTLRQFFFDHAPVIGVVLLFLAAVCLSVGANLMLEAFWPGYFGKRRKDHNPEDRP